MLLPSSGDLSDPGIEPAFPSLQADFFTIEPPRKHKYMDKILFKTEMPEPMNELKSYESWLFPQKEAEKKDESLKKEKL